MAPGFYQGPGPEVQRVTDRLSRIEGELLELYDGWERLESLRLELES
jgi:hypothetical protein